ncbi:hypothetical protein M9458_016324, partial [Cirrhinus mrigala]
MSMQWGHISRHYSTDRSSSIGSMESLENPPNQGYYDSQLSPIDPVIFNNKRDSAYSSFSASSNTSDYTVPVKPEDTNSMDSLLQGFGSSCRYPDGGQHCAPSGHGTQQDEREHSKIPQGAKVRPSSYSCEEEHCAPPQPPMRKDSFRATRGQATDKRCVSAPVGIPVGMVEDQSQIQEVLTGNVYLNGTQDNEQERKGRTIEPYYTFNSKRESNGDSKATECEKKQYSESVVASTPPLSPFSQRNRDENFDTQHQPERNLESVMHRHSAPEKLLASQLCMMDFSGDKSDCASPTCQWSQSPLYVSDTSPNTSQGKWGASRCSTPGSVATSELEDPRLEEDSLDSGQNLWGQPINVSGNPIENGLSTTNSQTSEKNLGSVGANMCVDTHLNVNAGEARVDNGSATKQPQKRQFRNSKSRRRSERFATNLRNEIQRKKAQLQKSRNPCGEETVEEEVADLNMETVAPPEYPQPKPQNLSSPPTSPPAAPMQIPKQIPQQVLDATQVEEHSRTKATPTQIPQHPRQEIAPAGKPRRWRWTPEYKLQPESNRTDMVWKNGINKREGRSVGRVRFFEETSRKLSQSVTNLSSLTSRNQRFDKLGRLNYPSSPEPLEMPTNLGRRRFSYQDVPYINSLDTGRQLTHQDQEKLRERLIEREQEKERQQERIKEQENLREQEREKERLRKEREKEQQRVKDWEDRQRLLQREQEQDSRRDTLRSEHSMSSETVPQSLFHEASWKQPPSPQNFYTNSTANIQKPCSAFHPVTTQHNQYDDYNVNPPYKARSYTPAE